MRTVVLLLALGACSQQPAEQASKPEAPAPAPTVTPGAPMQQTAMLSVPKDPAQLKRVQAMGYTVHEDHLHAPGVSSCPKMGDDPVM